MKKIVILGALAGLGFLGYKKWSEQQRENDVWSQATDPVEPRDLR
ncbi:MAG: DLW-39 family protein [Jiangellales bacterium]